MTTKDSFTTDDGLELRTRTWLPPAGPDASIVLIHGYGDHCGRYERFAQVLNNAALAVYSYDQRGFGRSPGKRGYVARFDTLLEDLDRFLERIATEIQGKPVFMMGQSFGGLIAVRYAETRRPDFAGLVLCNPFLGFPDNIPKPLLALGRFIAMVAPWMPVSKVDAQGLSRRPEVVAAADADPLSYHGSVRARTGAEMQLAIARAFQDISRLNVPLYIAHGEADRIVPASGSRELCARAPAKDKALHVYTGGFHELWQDLEDEAMMAEVCDWIRARL